MITKPLLAATLEHLNQVIYPVCATPKIDGIRCLKIGGKALSRSFKPIANLHVRNWVETHLPDGIDGELIAGDFGATSSAIMRSNGQPSFRFLAFDFVDASGLNVPYIQRVTNLLLSVGGADIVLGGADTGVAQSKRLPELSILTPMIIDGPEELQAFETLCLAEGYEGVMLRAPKGKYKCGRSTLNEGILIKRKLFSDAEATIIGFEEEMTNLNVADKDAFGRTKRSSHKANKLGAGTLGAFICREIKTGIEFRCGSGLDMQLSAEIWANQEKYLGKIIKFKYFAHGMKDSFRHPTFLGFRDPRDM